MIMLACQQLYILLCNRFCFPLWAFVPANTHGHTHPHTQGGSSPLHTASQKGYDGIVEVLLQAGAAVDLQTKVEDSCFICSVLLTMFIVH